MTRGATSASTSHVGAGAGPFLHEVGAQGRQKRTGGDRRRLGPQHVGAEPQPRQARRELRRRPAALGTDEHGRAVERRPAPVDVRQARRRAARPPRRTSRRRRPRAARSAGTASPPPGRSPRGARACLPALASSQRTTDARRRRARCGRRRARSASAPPSSGRSPFTSANATVSAGSGRASATTSPTSATLEAVRRTGTAATAPRRRDTVSGSPGPQPQHPGQVVAVVGRQHGRSRSSTKAWARASSGLAAGDAARPPPYLNAERILESNPLGGGATSSPRSSASRRRRSSSSLGEVGRRRRPRPRPAGRPGRGPRRGARPGRAGGTRGPSRVPRGMTRSSTPSSVSKSSVGAERGLGERQVAARDEVVAVALEAVVRRAPAGGRRGRPAPPPRGADRAAARRAAGSSPCRRRPGCRRCRSAPRPAGPRRGSSAHGLAMIWPDAAAAGARRRR